MAMNAVDERSFLAELHTKIRAANKQLKDFKSVMASLENTIASGRADAGVATDAELLASLGDQAYAQAAADNITVLRNTRTYVNGLALLER